VQLETETIDCAVSCFLT